MKVNFAKKTFKIGNMKLDENFLHNMMAKGLEESRKEKFEKTMNDTLFENTWALRHK